jgi:hypothetical protein
MPLYEYDNTITGKVEVMIKPVAERDDVDYWLVRRTVPSSIGVHQNLRNPIDTDQAMKRSLREMEIAGGSRFKEQLEKDTGFSREEMKRIWMDTPTSKEEITDE